MTGDRRGYLPIAEHGVIGDLHTIALVGTDGTIDWFCCPRFDSPSVFASILDDERGGWFRIAPAREDWTVKQLYFPDTNVLITRFLTPDGVAEVQDFMPIQPYSSVRGGSAHMHRHRLVRRVIQVRGQLRFTAEVEPRFDYARAEHTVEPIERGVVFRSPDLCLALQAGAHLERTDHGVRSEFTLDHGEAMTFVLERVEPGEQPPPHSEDETREAFERTIAFWRRWLAQSRYRGRWREMVHRSALTLKLLTYQPTGAIVAAPTTSLPEQLGGGPQLGLPLHLDPRRRLLALRPAPARLHGGGRGVHGLAHGALSARARARGRAAADHVRDRRPARPARGGARPLRGLPRLRAGADRQRRRQTSSSSTSTAS